MSVRLEKPWLLATLGYFALAVWQTFPLVTRLGDGVAHDRCDPLLNTWLLFWNAHRVPFTSAWWNGSFFHPLPGVLSLSENLTGLAPLTTPLQWLGLSPLATYNVMFILSFAASALAMHALLVVLTGRHGLGVVAGLGFGFAPYRAAHLAHLQILAASLIPIVFLALHEYLRTRQRRWLALFACAYVLQGLTNGYYLFFISVLLVLWVVWFVLPAKDLRLTAAIALTGALAVLALAPVLLEYARWHARFGLSRQLHEIEALSADVLGLVSPAPTLALWSFVKTGQPGESWLFPGLALPAVVVTALWWWLRTRSTRREGPAATVLAAVAAFTALTAAVTAAIGPWRWTIGSLDISVRALHKPLAIALYALVVSVLASRSCLAAWRSRSTVAFYGLATAAMFILALGPSPRAAGALMWDKAPYFHLLKLPGAMSFRVPARFAMLGVFCLAVAGALCLGWLLERTPRRRTAWLAIVALAVVADGWLRPLPVLDAPARLTAEIPAAARAVLELPLGGERDTSAMYRAMTHRLPVVNGYSGYDPPHYTALGLGLARHEPAVLRPFCERGPLFVVLDWTHPRAADLEDLILAEGGTRQSDEREDERAYLLPAAPGTPRPVHGGAIPLTIVRGAPSRATFDLGRIERVGAVSLAFGDGASRLPPSVQIEISDEPPGWRSIWDGPIAGRAIEAALRDPLRVPIVLATPGAKGRFLRIRVEVWTIQEVTVFRPQGE